MQNDDYPGRYASPDLGKARVNEWLSEYSLDRHQIEAESDVMRLTAGQSFNIGKHPRSAINRDYLPCLEMSLSVLLKWRCQTGEHLLCPQSFFYAMTDFYL
ncbi:phage late control D family protein [Vibrio mediterranei]|uniref:Uncharacterized protein n=1 Tax=Vibrio mediterranei TaxID=689 RepID=A0AAN1FK76_9VIBR|nr:phage late control D family protein [Vibrio mediterranei]ASI91792.1 hypothetical protein BSZ05_18280 [Vibrio mediterranei]